LVAAAAAGLRAELCWLLLRCDLSPPTHTQRHGLSVEDAVAALLLAEPLGDEDDAVLRATVCSDAGCGPAAMWNSRHARRHTSRQQQQQQQQQAPAQPVGAAGSCVREVPCLWVQVTVLSPGLGAASCCCSWLTCALHPCHLRRHCRSRPTRCSRPRRSASWTC
jgi:hypothetical protein